MRSIKIELIFTLYLLLLTPAIKAQGFLDKIYAKDCVTIESDSSIFSEFHQIALDLPHGWTGCLEGELPAFSIKNKEKTCSVTISAAYDASGIFDWAREKFDLVNYEIVEKGGRQILIEKYPERNQYTLSISNKSETNGTWIWRMQIRYALKIGVNAKCELSFLINQLIKEN